MSKASVIILILSCAMLGGYASNYLAFHHGFFDAINDCIDKTSSRQKSQCILVRSSTTYRAIFTGIPAIDDLVAVLLGFFTLGLVQDYGSIDWQAVVGMVYMASQFGALWTFMTLEGLRKTNHNRLCVNSLDDTRPVPLFYYRVFSL